MIKLSTLSEEELTQFVKRYIDGPLDFHQMVEAQKSHNKGLLSESILRSLSDRVKQFLVSLEKEMLMAQKISSLIFYDSNFGTLYPLMVTNLKQLVPAQLRGDFLDLYINSISTPGDIIYQRQYKFIHSDQKLQVYRLFTSFTQEQGDLHSDPDTGSLPLCEIGRVFPRRDLELLYRVFRECSFNSMATYQRAWQLGLRGPEYSSQFTFTQRVDNVLLLGLYQIYSSLCSVQSAPVRSWQQFTRIRYETVNFDECLGMLFRVGVRRDPTAQEILQVNRLIVSNTIYRSTGKKRRSTSQKRKSAVGEYRVIPARELALRRHKKHCISKWRKKHQEGAPQGNLNQ